MSTTTSSRTTFFAPRSLAQPPPPLSRVPVPNPRIGVVAGGLSAYWPQFDGLRQHIEQTNAEIVERLRSLDADTVNFGLVSSTVEGNKVAHAVNAADVDVLFVLVSTYMTSGQILPVLRDTDVPIVLVGLQPSERMDHATFGTGDWLAYAGSAGMPEIAVAMERLGKRVDAIAGHLDDHRAWSRIDRYVAVARVKRTLSRARHGMMGHLYPGMYDIATNITSVLGALGGHVETLEYDDLRVIYEKVSDAQASARLADVAATFDASADVDSENVLFQARVSVALDTLVNEFDLATLAYFHFGRPGDIYYQLATGFPIGATLLTSRGIPTVTEFELRAAIAMLITSLLGGGGTLTEGQAMDFTDGVVELGHNDAADLSITETAPVLRNLDVFHGKGGGGASIECGVALGPVTQLSLGELGNGRLKLIVSEGEAVDGPHIKIGNTTTRVDFGCDPGLWTEKWAVSGSTHHWSMARGHLAEDLRLAAEILGVDFDVVQP